MNNYKTKEVSKSYHMYLFNHQYNSVFTKQELQFR